ncbi:hypothetical protein [uncultured Nostoc sp.]|uniref:hypothetical protein n=1 Tax=uncultured Nostoc sp. TaxID=340711 RepID=UPI0035C9B593
MSQLPKLRSDRAPLFSTAITHLQQLQVFPSSTIAQFYAQARWQYPKVQTYLQMLDYLRLLTLEYLQMQQTMQPISA